VPLAVAPTGKLKACGRRCRSDCGGAKAAAQAVLALRGEDSHYEPSNGRRLVVTPYGERLELRYGRRAVQQMRHDGRGSFVSRDGSVTMQFEVDGHGQAQLVRLSAPGTWF
jgi:hypothetical protein